MTKPKKINDIQFQHLFVDILNGSVKRLGRFIVGKYMINVTLVDENLSPNQRSKLKKDRWKLKGLCSRCGGKRDDKNLITCKDCRKKDRDSRMKK